MLPKYFLAVEYESEDDEQFFNELKSHSDNVIPNSVSNNNLDSVISDNHVEMNSDSEVMDTDVPNVCSNVSKTLNLTVVKMKNICIKGTCIDNSSELKLINKRLCKTNKKLVIENNILKSKNNKIIADLKKYKKKCLNSEKEIVESEKDMALLNKKIKQLENNLTCLESREFKIENIIKDNKLLNFYTGFKNIDFYSSFETLVKNCYENTYYNASNMGRPKSLSLENELFLYFARLRCALLEEDLAFRFKISTSTVSRIFAFWNRFLSDMLSKIPIWLTRNTVNDLMPADLKREYPSTRVIIDATEMFVEIPSDFRVQSDSFSQYKHNNTAKGVTGVSPNGLVTFVSDLAPGKLSDKKLTIQSGLFNLLEPGDSVMADRGFLIEEELKQLQVGLNIPAFMNGRTQLSEEDEDESRRIATFRINVERVFREVKTFRILKTVFPNSMHDQLNDVWKVCNYLVNFTDEPLLER